MVEAMMRPYMRAVEMERSGDVFSAQSLGYSRLLRLVSRSGFDVLQVVAGRDVLIDARASALPVAEVNGLFAHLPMSEPGTRFLLEVAPDTSAVHRVTAIFLEGLEPTSGRAAHAPQSVERVSGVEELERQRRHHHAYNEAWSEARGRGLTVEEAHKAAGEAAYRSFSDGSV